MRFEGTLTTWNDDRGFGHIQPTQGGEPVFVHISAWPKGAGRPQLKQAVSFELEQGPKGQRARKVALLQTRPTRPTTPRPGRPQGRRPGRARHTPWNAATWLPLAAFLMVYALVDLLWRPPLWVAAWYGVASVAAFIAYAIDTNRPPWAVAGERPRAACICWRWWVVGLGRWWRSGCFGTRPARRSFGWCFGGRWW